MAAGARELRLTEAAPCQREANDNGERLNAFVGDHEMYTIGPHDESWVSHVSPAIAGDPDGVAQRPGRYGPGSPWLC